MVWVSFYTFLLRGSIYGSTVSSLFVIYEIRKTGVLSKTDLLFSVLLPISAYCIWFEASTTVGEWMSECADFTLVCANCGFKITSFSWLCYCSMIFLVIHFRLLLLLKLLIRALWEPIGLDYSRKAKLWIFAIFIGEGLNCSLTDFWCSSEL
jgi:hypothetical protein